MQEALSRMVFAAGLACVGLLVGCSSSHGGKVRLFPHESGETFVQPFNEAYAVRADTGEYDIVFVDNAMVRKYPQSKEGRGSPQTLRPLELAPLRQVMHLHLHWKPLSRATVNPAAVNASITWYVLGPDGTREMLVYEGAGLVAVERSGDEWTVVIRDGLIKRAASRGTLADPIGEARLTGRVIARPNSARTRELIGEMRRDAPSAAAQAP